MPVRPSRSARTARPLPAAGSRSGPAPLVAALLLAAAILPIAAPAAAAVPRAARPDGPATIVVYSDGFALVRRPLALDLAAGTNDVTMEGVAPTIDSTSVRLTGDGFSVRRQEFRYDVWNAGRVFERFLGDTITFRAIGRPYRGLLAGIDGDDLFIQRRDSSDVLMMLKRFNISEIDFPRALGLATRPSLSWRIEASKAGPKRAALSYLADGVRWEAEYAAVLDASGGTVAWSGWATIVNRCGESFDGAHVALVAGDVHRAGESVGRGEDMEEAAAAPPPKPATDFFTYHEYAVADPIDLGTAATVQVPLVPESTIHAMRTYRYDGARDGSRVRVALEFANDRKEGLGMPLPAGRVRIYAPDAAGVLTLAGEDAIPHTAAGEHVRVLSGVAFDLVGERTRVAHARVSRAVTEDQYRIRLRNRGAREATVTVAENLYGNWEITDHSSDFRKKDAENVEFDVKVPAGGESTLTFTVRYTY
ncbi:MAG: DUF4139 domain-containing protein [Hyphomicrobiales bacterium]